MDGGINVNYKLSEKYFCVCELKVFFMRMYKIHTFQFWVPMILRSLLFIFERSEILHSCIVNNESLMVHKLFRTLLMSLESQFKVLARMPLGAAMSKRG